MKSRGPCITRDAGPATQGSENGKRGRVHGREERDFGGTCPNRGCTPKKVLVAAAHALHEIAIAGAHGIEVGAARLDWAKLIGREKDMVSFIPGAMEATAGKRGEVFKGTAKFVGPNAVEVDGTVLEGENIVIATGSKPRPLPISGAELLITSDEVLSEETQPGEVVFIGGGVIAMEFSHVYARAGTEVTILEALPRLLPRMEADAVAAIQGESERLGIAVKTGVEVKEISPANGSGRSRPTGWSTAPGASPTSTPSISRPAT
jgi:glutathione reductase (NADPH)